MLKFMQPIRMITYVPYFGFIEIHFMKHTMYAVQWNMGATSIDAVLFG